jgi:hypothetical protein
VGAISLYAVARRLDAPPRHAIYPAVFFLLSRPVLEQTLGANVDLICAALFLTSINLGLIAVERDRRGDWILWGASVGLYAGSKYLALVYLPVLALFVMARGVRPRMAWALPGIAAFALPWYARNWIITGSPIYPASLTLAGLSIARGAFDRTAMLNSVFHTNDVRLLGVIAAHAFGPTLLVVWIPAAIVGSINLVRRRLWPDAFIVALPYAMLPFYWFGLPVNIDSRFLMPAIAPALVPLAFTFRGRRWWDAGWHVFYAASMTWIIVGLRREIRADVPWYMRGWTSLQGLIDPEFIWWFAATVLMMTLVWAIMAGTIAIVATGLAIVGEHWCVPSRCEYINATSPHIPMDLVFGWRWIAEHAHESTIAYTGINLPYPLTGQRLSNRVVYVNIDDNPAWRFHDYDRALRAGRFKPAPPLLASASGELLPARPSEDGSTNAVRPRYERMEGSRGAWIDNLHRSRVEYLFVSALSPYEVGNIWHNDRGFPIEDVWASSDPAQFHLAYENPYVRIFAVGAEEQAQ